MTYLRIETHVCTVQSLCNEICAYFINKCLHFTNRKMVRSIHFMPNANFSITTLISRSFIKKKSISNLIKFKLSNAKKNPYFFFFFAYNTAIIFASFLRATESSLHIAEETNYFYLTFSDKCLLDL